MVLCKAQLLKLLKLDPGQGEVGHELLEGPRLLGLPLCVQRDLLTELPRVGAARAGRGGHGARPALAG